jgi:hypothetical protein
MVNETKNVFISHIHEDDSKLGDLKSLLKSNGIGTRDYSITSDKPNQAKSEEYIKSQILKPQIKQCSVLVVYVSPETKNSDYVNWEIEYAHKQGIRVVGVWENGEKGCELPEALEEYRDAMAGWHGNSIVDAILGDDSIQENPDGSTRNPRDITRHPCG